MTKELMIEEVLYVAIKYREKSQNDEKKRIFILIFVFCKM